MPSVEKLDCSSNLLSSLQNSSNTLKYLNIFNNNLTTLDIHNFPNLEELALGSNKFVDLDFSGHHKIGAIYKGAYNVDFFYINNPAILNTDTYLKSFNANNCTSLTTLILNSSVLEKLFIKNGVDQFLDFYFWTATPSQYICCDESEVASIQNELANSGNTTCNINTYCSFTPGGNHNTITGTVRFDENNNGCDINDEVFEHMKVKIDDGITTGETFVKSNGKYDFYTQTGDFTITAEPENASLFTVTPSTFTTNFANNNNNTFTQNLCVTKNGNIKDLEVVFAPVTDARPGFDAIYKIIWRNKGNTTLSGNATLSFDASKMSFVSSVLPSSVTGNLVTFNFTNLKPYQNTSSEITFTINTPTNPTNPVNNGDILNFTAGVNPVLGDVNPDDNQFVYKQTVVGSFDPNDITCLEGNLIPLSMVGKYLHYIVNFENTGTAPATNIVVEMDINPDDFDINTLQLQNTSHNTYTKITGNKVEFMMKDINLAAAAHGNIVLKIKSKNNLVSGDSVINKANIYFDYNFPVTTNEATTNIINSSLATTEIIKGNSSVNVYPNPTKDDVNIEADSKIKSIEVYDIQGRILQKQIGINTPKTKISLQNTMSGTYIFKIATDRETITKKVTKK
ncbi:T9SS type A sorting domain-containing protein [Chryseobacterium ginsenosidimutans]|uniref:T9SS type A sorting domain-containing protein n=1 Tax=Chryseobacterium ginsenosidimutans TaxID=687846 RepID=UPI0031DDB2FF